ncbi:hypothetical protein SPRG_15465 [Saprolegnia parasitica CBS 223.65]|uniref:Uncharacterized protein n=1 Tax=Saprolegnia parasitica (strain CBS 223.65) TaxID=695850 RepID=A0A067BRE5_SAPPC|nr:hypothetical protein SPRG_15465 [Saprolegnia parasitica CBS 223.65]KDO19375.1 hypothetical protein SPRG_15465 [Saprolegnia parasitica CBS 223.65]|eukprot:XP_012209921.1 hypothetical protein SPRG_15465 [Saprolegnia parasitica CBS 223.65]
MRWRQDNSSGFMTLRVLHLHRNSLQDHHAIALAKKLPARSLTVLDVSLNYIENAGIEALASVLPHLPTLQRLDVSHNAYDTIAHAALERARLPTLRLQGSADFF